MTGYNLFLNISLKRRIFQANVFGKIKDNYTNSRQTGMKWRTVLHLFLKMFGDSWGHLHPSTWFWAPSSCDHYVLWGAVSVCAGLCVEELVRGGHSGGTPSPGCRVSGLLQSRGGAWAAFQQELPSGAGLRTAVGTPAFPAEESNGRLSGHVPVSGRPESAVCRDCLDATWEVVRLGRCDSSLHLPCSDHSGASSSEMRFPFLTVFHSSVITDSVMWLSDVEQQPSKSTHHSASAPRTDS